ncbi:MAG: US12 family protein [Bacteroidetes bacterium]|nr:US12 family protein [Bacteroidota bacterium]
MQKNPDHKKLNRDFWNEVAHSEKPPVEERTFFIHVFFLVAVALFSGAVLMLLFDKLSFFHRFFYESQYFPSSVIIAGILSCFWILILWHFKFHVPKTTWLAAFFTLLCLVSAFFLSLLAFLGDGKFLIYPFISVSITYFAAALLSLAARFSLNRNWIIFLLLPLGIIFSILVNYYFQTRVLCWVLSFFFTFIVCFLATNRNEIVGVFNTKDHPEVSYSTRIFMAAFPICFPVHAALLRIRTIGKVHMKYRWFTDFERISKKK